MSKGALCATRKVELSDPRNSKKEGRTSSIFGASQTIASVIPVRTVMNGGISLPGLTSVWNSPMTMPPRIFTAPISVISAESGDPPVVSKSTTTKVASFRSMLNSSIAI